MRLANIMEGRTHEFSDLNTLVEMSRIMFAQAFEHHGLIKMAYKINNHSGSPRAVLSKG
jgi:hypothetical protein